MASGSWTGRPAETIPSDISPWGRYALGWIAPGDNLGWIHIDQLNLEPSGVYARLEQVERWGGTETLNALRISLPPKPYYVNTPYSGTCEWFGGKADLIDTTLIRDIDLTGKTSATLSFATWYQIEDLWDFGFVQVSEDDGATWTSLAIAGTTTDHDPQAMPEIVANLPGFTGSSNGRVVKTQDISGYAGKKIKLQFRYMTDWGTTLNGFFVDDIRVVADGTELFFDDVETLDPAWTVNGWTREKGSGTKTHYYMLEWRNTNTGFDNGLNWAYSFDPWAANPDQPWWFRYEPGLLLWYRDMSYTDNWVGVHPGHGFLLVVDAHWQPMLRPHLGVPWFSRIQMHDAPFNFKRVYDIVLSRYGFEKTYQGDNAVPNFDDSFQYYSNKAPHSSVIITPYGLKFRVVAQASDMSAVAILLWSK